MSLFDRINQLESEKESIDPNDYSNSLNVLNAPSWRSSAPEKRGELIDRGMSAIMSGLEKDYLKQVPYFTETGERKMAPAWTPAKTPTKAQYQYLDISKKMLNDAARDPDGGLQMDEMSGEVSAASWTKGYFENAPEKQMDMLPDYEKWFKDGGLDDASKATTWDDYVSYANAEVDQDEAKIDPENKALKQAWARRTAQATFDPGQMGEEQIVQDVGGSWIINPKNYSEIDKVEATVSALDIPSSEKKRMLLEYREKLEEVGGKVVNEFAAADAGFAGLGRFVSSPLRDEFIKASESKDFSVYDFIKNNKERFSKDSYGVSSEIAIKFEDALLAGGAGALFIAGKGIDFVTGDKSGDNILYRPAEELGWLAETTSSAYSNTTQFSVGGIDINRKDLTELTGQVGSFFAMGGIGSAGAKGLSMMAGKAAIKAPALAGAAGYLAKATTKAPIDAAARTLAAETYMAKSMGAKAMTQVKAVFTDSSAYLGGLQASGTSYGKTFNQIYETTGDRQKAHNEASIDGISTGLSALIATGVMNRFGMGAEAILGAGDDVAGSILSKARSYATTRSGMEATKKMLVDVIESPELRKQIGKDLLKSMNESAKARGLKGWGIVGGTAAEAVEESMDEVLSTVFSTMMDDSKTWKEDVWQHIGTNWKDYVKAGVLGAIGGAGGQFAASAKNPIKSLQRSGEEKAYNASWDIIKQNVPSFSDATVTMPGTGDSKTIAEYIAWDGDGSPSIEEKSAALLEYARNGVKKGLGAAVVPTSTTATEPQEAGQAASATTSPNQPDSSVGGVLEALGVTPDEGMGWSSGLDFTEEELVKVGKRKSITGKTDSSLTPLSITSEDGGTFSIPAAKLKTKDGERILAGKELVDFVNDPVNEVSKSDKKRLTLDNSGVESFTANKASFSQAKVEAEATASEASTPTSPTKQKLIDDKVSEPELIKMAQYKSVFNGPDNEELVTKQAAAAAILTEKGVDFSQPKAESNAEAKTPSSNVGRTSFDSQNGSTFIETTSKKNGKNYGITAEPNNGGTKWVLSNEDSKRAGEYSGSIPMERSESRENAVKALGEEFVAKVEAAHKLASKRGIDGSEEAGNQIEAALAGLKTEAKPPAPASTTAAPNESPPPVEASKQQPVATNENKSKTEDQGKRDEKGNVLETPPPAEDLSPAGNASTDSRVKAVVKKGIERKKNISYQDTFTDENSEYEETDGIFVRKEPTGTDDVVITDKALEGGVKSLDVIRKINQLAPKSGSGSTQAAFGFGKRKAKAKAESLDDETIDNLNEESSYVVNKSDIEFEGESKGGEGQWSKTTAIDNSSSGDLYNLKPKEGTTLNISVGDIITISGTENSEVLKLVDIIDGDFVFKKDNISDFKKGEDIQFFKDNGYGRNILKKLSSVVADEILKGNSFQFDAENVKSAFKAALKIVSPTATFKVDKIKVVGDESYLRANSNGDKGKGSIEVDYEAFAKDLNEQFGKSKPTTDFGKKNLALDVSRTIASKIDEEVIHIIAFRVFTEEEIEQFIFEIQEQNEAYGDSTNVDIFVREFRQTVIERLGKDALGEAIVGEDAITVGSELIRKIHQLGNAGFTAEMAMDQSMRLQMAVAMDEQGMADKNTQQQTFFRTVGEMIRRYANRVRMILSIKWQQGRLTDHQRSMMERLNKAYQEYGIKGDVDLATDAAKESINNREEKYSKMAMDSLNQLGRNNATTLSRLSTAAKGFPNGTRDQLFSVDTAKGELMVSPEMREFIKQDGTVPMEDLDKLLADLNKGNGQDSTYVMARNSAFLKRQKMIMNRDSLDVSFSQDDLFMGLVDKGRKGYLTDFALWKSVVASAPENVSNAELTESFDKAQAESLKELQKLDAESELKLRIFVATAKQELEGLKFGEGVSAISKLVAYTKVMKMPNPLRATATAGLVEPTLLQEMDDYLGLNAFANEDAAEWTNESIEGKTADEALVILGKYRDAALAKLPMWAATAGNDIAMLPPAELDYLPSDTAKDSVDFASDYESLDAFGRRTYLYEQEKAFKAARFKGILKNEGFEVGKLLAEFYEQKYEMLSYARELEAQRDAFVDGLQERSQTTAVAPEGQLETASLSEADFNNFKRFIDSVEDYNQAITKVLERSLGNWGVKNGGFGLDFKDLKGSDMGDVTTISSSEEMIGLVENDPGFLVLKANLIEKHVKMSKAPNVSDEDNTAMAELYRNTHYSSPFQTAEKNKLDKSKRIRLSQEQIEYNNYLTAYRSAVESNAEFVGRRMWVDYYVAKHTGKIWDLSKMEQYEATGGFAFNYKTDSETEDDVYEKVYEAFPENSLGGIASALSSLLNANLDVNEETIGRIYKEIQLLKDWKNKIRSNISSSPAKNKTPLILEIGGKQTLAGRFSVLLEDVFGSEDTSFNDVLDGLQGNVDKILDSNGYGSVNGVMKPKPNKQAIRKALDDLRWSSTYTNAIADTRETFNMVKLTRRALNAFADDTPFTGWRANTHKEGTRIQRDPAYETGDPTMAPLRNVASDIRTSEYLRWALNYFSKERRYFLSPNFTSEAQEEFESLQYGEGYEPFVTVSKQDVEQGRQPIDNPDAAVTTGREAQFDERRPIPGGTGETTNTVEGFGQTASGKFSTQEQTATRAYGKAKVSRGIVVAKWALMIGSNSSKHFNVNEGQQFYVDLMKMDMVESEDSGLTAEDVNRERRRYISGLANSNSTDVLNSGEFNQGGIDSDVDSEIQKLSKEQLKSYFSAAHMRLLLDRALKGAFRDPSGLPLGEKSLNSLRDAFLAEQGGGYKWSSSEKFLHDVIDFKAKFEKMSVEIARIKDGGLAMSGLETIFNSLGQTDVEGDYKFTDNNGKKHKFTDQFFSKEMKLAMRDQLFSQTKARQFNDPQEAIAIGKFLHKGLFGGTIKKVFSDYEATPKDYLLTETKKQEKKDKEAAEREARGEKEEAPKGKPKAIPRSDFPMYDLALGFPPNTEHVLLDQILSTLPGKTYVVVPTAKDITRNPDLRNIGLTIFEGKNGNPHIIYSPAVSDKKVTGSQVARNLAVSMKLSGESNPKVKQAITELGAKISDAMSPMSLLERYSLDHQFKLSPSLTEKASEGVNPLDFVQSGLESGELLTPFDSLKLTEEEKTTLSEAITKQFMEASRLASELMLDVRRQSEVEGVVGDSAFEDSLILISEVLSNPKLKHLLDMSFLEGDVNQITGTELKPELEVEIMDFIRNFGGVVTTDERNFFNEEKADEDSTEGLQEQAPQIQNSVGESNPVSLSPIDRTLYEIALARGDREEASRIWSKDAWPSDTTLFNFLTSMIVEGKRENGGLDEAAHAASADALDMPMRDVLKDSKDEFTSPMVGEEKAQQGQTQLDTSAAFKKASRVYVGEVRNLMQSSNGTRTFLNVSFGKPRIENMNASVVAQNKSIQDKIRTEGVSIIDGYKAEKKITNIESGTKLPSGQISIPLNDAFMAQLEEVLPSGEVALAMREERESIEALERDLVVRSLQRQKLQEKLDELKEGATEEEFRNNPGAQRKAIDKLVRIYERYSEVFLSENNKFNGVGSLLNKHILDDFRTTGARAFLGMANANVNAIRLLLQERKQITASPDPSTDQEVDPEASIRVEEINNEIREQIELYDENVNAFNSRIENAIKRFGRQTHFMIAPEVIRELKLKQIGDTREDYAVENLSNLDLDVSGSIYAKVDVLAQEEAIQSVINESVFRAFGEEAYKAFVPDTSNKPGKNGKVVNREKAKELFNQIRDLKRNQKKSVGTIINGMRLDAEYSNNLQELLEVFALSDAEISEMVSNGARSAVATKRMNELDNGIWTLSREIDKTEDHLNKVSNVDGETSFNLGRTAYVDGNLKVGIDINMTAGEYPQTYEESRDQPAPDHVLRERRKDYAIKRAAMLKVLNHFSSVQIQDAYDFAKKGATMSEDFNPIATIAKAIAINKVQNQIVAERFGQAVDDKNLVLKERFGEEALSKMSRLEKDKADLIVMNHRQLAMLLDPASKEFQALTSNEQGRIQIMHMPQSFKEREATLGRYFENDGLSIVMMPTNAKEELMRMHPTTVNRRNVNSRVKDIVLSAKKFSDQALKKEQIEPYFIEALNNIRKDFYPSDKYTAKLELIKEGSILGEAAEAYSNEFGKLIQEALNQLRNVNNVAQGKIGNKEVDLTGYLASQQLTDYKKMIEFIVLSLGHPAISESKTIGMKDSQLKKTVTEFLNKIESAGKDNFANFNKVTGNAVNLAEFNVAGTFATVLSAVEAGMISQRITLGLTVEDNSVYDFNMKYSLHQDARIRNRNRKSWIARQASQHLISILDHGFTKGGGRQGYETAAREIKKNIAEASEKIQGGKLSTADNYNQTLGYIIAMLRGLNESNGQSIATSFYNWRKAISLGFEQNKMFVEKQKNVKVNNLIQKVGLANVSRYWNGNHIDLVRDSELAQEMESVLSKLGIIGKNAISSNPAPGQTIDERAQEVIEKAIQDILLEVKDGKSKEVDNYADVIHENFKDIDAAMHLTVAMTAKDTESISKSTISSVPIRLAYAANPAAKQQIQEGKFISDPLDMVKITDSSFFGGNVSSDNTYQKKGVFRPIAINGITAPLSLVDDAVYRLKVAPTYGILRKAIGKVQTNQGINTVDPEESEMLTQLSSSDTPVLQAGETDNQFKKRQRDFKFNFKNTQTAFSGIAIELETILQNDMQRGVVNTGGAETMRVLGSLYVVRALTSVQQLWDQTASASVGYTAGKIASGNAKSAAMYWKVLGKMMVNKEFRKAARKYIKENSPYVFYRAAEGADVARDQVRGQRRFGRNKTKTLVGKGIRSIEQTGELVLDFTIASGERFLASTMFFVEIAEQMNGDINTIEEIIRSGSTVEPTVQQIKNAQLKVNDMMGQSDQAKKSWFFQTRDKNPTINSLWKSIVRFSNHTASTSANTAVMSRSTFGETPEGISPSDWQRNKEEARENVVSSLVQNVLFFPMKIKNLTVMMAMAYFMASGDDDDEAARKAQKFANKALVPDEDSNIAAKVAKILLLGGQRELFQSNEKIDASQASAFAEIMSKSLVEGSTVLPYAGSLIGYSPVSGFLAKTFTNDVSKATSAAMMDVDKNDVFIRQYNSDALESGADLTNPTSVVYDYAQATKLMIDYSMTRHAERNRAQSTFDIGVYFLTEALPFLREARGYYGKELKKVVKKETPKNKR